MSYGNKYVCVILGISYVPNVTILYSMYYIFMYMNSEYNKRPSTNAMPISSLR